MVALVKVVAGRSIAYDQAFEITSLEIFDDGPSVRDRQFTAQGATTLAAAPQSDPLNSCPWLLLPGSWVLNSKLRQRIAEGRRPVALRDDESDLHRDQTPYSG